MADDKEQRLLAENPGDDAQASTADDSSKRRKAEGANSKVEGKKRQSSPASKSSVKSRLKALITEEMSKRKGRGRHRRSSTCPARSQLTGTGLDLLAEAHTDDPLPEIALNDESPRVGDENKEISSDSSSEDQVLPKSSEEPCTSDENGEECGIMFSGNDSSHEQVDESEKLLIEKAIFCHDLNDRKQAFLKQKSISSKELTKDGSAHQSKYFTDARDIINMNKGFLLTILQDPGSPLAHYFHKQQAISAKMGITKSGTFPSHGSSSRRGSAPRKQNHMRDGQKPPDHESTEDICRKSMPLKAADHRADGIHQLNQANAEVPDMTTSGTLGKSESQVNLTGIRETLSVSSDQLASNSSTHSKTIAQVGKTSDELGNLIIGDIVSQSEQDSKREIVVPITKLAEPSPIPLLNFNLEGKTASTPAEISKSQGLELTQSHGFPTRLDILADEEHEFKDFPKVAEGRAKFEKLPDKERATTD
ncbi:protein of unknown function DUF3741 - like 4 [Theobroma cacao]|nr:protein of unknown function DUF3741 - like 4 [Theobroma cacao]